MTAPLVTVALLVTVGLGLVAVGSRDYLVSILSLSGGSIALAVYFYLAGAAIAAVFEAVVAAGLVTVLFLFVVSLTETNTAERITGPKRTIVGLAIFTLGGVAVAVWPLLAATGGTASDITFADALWSGRSVDVLAVTILIFVGVLAVVRLTAQRIEIDLERPSETPGEVES